MKTAISVTLAPDNLLWLKARAHAQGSRSISAALDALLSEARRNRGSARTVVGTVRLPQGEEGLREGDAEMARLFSGVLGPRPVKPKRSRRRG